MLRGCVQHGVGSEAVRRWAGEYERLENAEERPVDGLMSAFKSRRLLSLAEWRSIAADAVRDGVLPAAAGASAGQDGSAQGEVRSGALWEWLILSGLEVAQRPDRELYAEVIQRWLDSWQRQAR